MSNAYRLVKSTHTRWEPSDGKDTRDDKGGGKRAGKHVVYQAGSSRDVMRNLSTAEIRRLGDRIVQVSGLSVPVHSAPAEPAPAAPAAPKAASPSPPAEPISEPDPAPTSYDDDIADTPWQTLKARVADMEDADEVRAVLAVEESGKARQSVLDACRARLEELTGSARQANG